MDTVELSGLKESKIIIIDDLEVNLILLKRILEIDGYTNVITIDESEQVVDLIIKEEADLVLLDLYMPQKSGIDVLEELRERTKDNFIPVIMITAQDSDEGRKLSLEKGAKDFIAKPFNSTELLLRIKNTLETKALHNIIKRDNESLDEKVRLRTIELEELQYELINKMLKAAEFRDNDTGEHIERIGRLSYIIANGLGMESNHCEELMAASMMHDIGKIAVPDSILLSESRLSKDEWVVMKSHTLKGADILSGSKFSMIQMAEQIARYHHEKWDGSGYPYGFSGEDIPIESRITAICDVFDALVSRRTYKAPWTVEEALDELKKESGKHFDPQIVETFFRVLPEIVEVYHGQ